MLARVHEHGRTRPRKTVVSLPSRATEHVSAHLHTQSVCSCASARPVARDQTRTCIDIDAGGNEGSQAARCIGEWGGGR
eukprot:8574283-Alexandrium_andersonii.AAC.1